MDANLETVAQIKSSVIDLAIKFGPKVLVALIILAVGVFVGRWVGRGTERMFKKLQLEPPIRILLVRVVRVLVFGLFLIMALQNLGVELLPLIAGIGLAGAGIALAMQGVLSNVVAGLTIIFTRPFRVGEYIAIAGVEGRVDAIQLFNTTLGHTDLSRVVVPNRKIVGEILHNYGQIRQIEVYVGVAYDTDLTKALAAIHAVLQSNVRALKDPAPVIQVVALADYSINIGVKPWVKVPDYIAAAGEIHQAIVETFRSSNIVMPFPQREVRIISAAA